MAKDHEKDPETKRESGVPGGGSGRQDRVGPTGVYPFSTSTSPDDAEVVPSGSFGQGERGAAGYQDSGRSEISQIVSTPEQCRDIMTKNPICCLASDSIGTVARLMRSQRIGVIPIVESTDKKRLIGIVTDRDLVVRILAEDREGRTSEVGEVMTTSPVACSPEDKIEACLDTMERFQIRRMPVVDNVGELVGIISQADIALRMMEPNLTAQFVQELSRPKAA